MNSTIQYPPVGHLAAPFTTNAATGGETFQNGDFFLVVSTPYTVDSSLAILNTVSTDFVAFLAKMNSKGIFLRFDNKDWGNAVQKMWNASRFCVSSLRRGHANLLCIVPILVYVLPKQVQDIEKI